jgi:hypothetical protein
MTTTVSAIEAGGDDGGRQMAGLLLPSGCVYVDETMVCISVCTPRDQWLCPGSPGVS